MKLVIKNFAVIALGVVMLAPVSLMAQNEEKKEAEQIIITRKGDKSDKLVVEVVGDKITVNGKEIDKNGKDGEVSVIRTKIRDLHSLSGNRLGVGYNGDANVFLNSIDEDRAMLGVTTEKSEKGAEVKDVTKESGADKAGIKEGDVITRIGDKKIESPDDLSVAIKGRKPGDKIEVTYLRDKSEKKVSAELTKWKGAGIYSISPQGNFNFNMDGFDIGSIMPRGQAMSRARTPYMQNWNWSGAGTPRLGMSVQDAEDGKGVNVIGVDEDGNAGKAGIQEEDIITEIDGKAVNSADEVAKMMKDSKDKVTVKMKILRKGKTETVEVKIPRKLKTADL